MSYSNKEEYEAQVREFREKYPDFKPAKDIEVLNLIMTRKNAKEIIEGKKKVEFRAYSDHYVGRLFDRNVLDFLKNHDGDKVVEQAVEDGIVDPLRVVRKIHFHDYNNSWYLDVEVAVNDNLAITKEDVEMLHTSYDCHEMDAILRSLELQKEKERPLYFFFGIEKVTGTNLK
uniref:Uncharacterized protein n=1 Tax=Siphoviridae sp. ctmHK36 TaxID=2827931 RepID=A0A8S5TB09_9CAUD|nr:MAG TPA: hypothetical protein [Siphoviridae sp. ctmHK36]